MVKKARPPLDATLRQRFPLRQIGTLVLGVLLVLVDTAMKQVNLKTTILMAKFTLKGKKLTQ